MKLIGYILLFTSIMAAVITGLAIMEHAYMKKAIEHQCAVYDSKTGNFTWKEIQHDR